MVTQVAPGACSPTPFVRLGLPSRAATAPLPMTRDEALARGWKEIDVVFITGRWHGPRGRGHVLPRMKPYVNEVVVPGPGTARACSSLAGALCRYPRHPSALV